MATLEGVKLVSARWLSEARDSIYAETEEGGVMTIPAGHRFFEMLVHPPGGLDWEPLPIDPPAPAAD